LVAVGTTDNKVSLLYFPDLEPAVPTFGVDAELVDLDWGGEKGKWVGLSASMPPFLSDTKVQLAVTTTASLLLYHVVLDTPIKLDLKQTIYPPTLDITPVAFRSVRYVFLFLRFRPPTQSSFSPTHMSPPTLHAVLNASQVRKRGAPRRGFVCTFGLVAGPSHAPITTAEKEGKGKEKEPNEPEELGKWDVLVRREVAGKPVTVFDIR
jgi:prolactin regulatory element-binding protein